MQGIWEYNRQYAIYTSFTLKHTLYEFKVLMAQGKKLFLRHLYLLPEGMSLNRCCPGCEGSPVIALALLRYYLLAMSSSESRGLPVMCCAVLMTLCRFFLSATEQWAYQAVMQYIRMLSMVLR